MSRMGRPVVFPHEQDLRASDRMVAQLVGHYPTRREFLAGQTALERQLRQRGCRHGQLAAEHYDWRQATLVDRVCWIANLDLARVCEVEP